MSRRKCCFSEQLERSYPMFKRSKTKEETFCEACNKHISVVNKGKADLEQHLQSSVHKLNIQSASCSRSIGHYFVQENSKSEEKILAADATLAYHTVKHHQSYKSCDCSTKLYRRLFSDSEVATKMSSARTKTEAIMNKILASWSLNHLMQMVNEDNILYVGVCTDGSNHCAIKMFPIVIQYFDKSFGIRLSLIEITSVPDEKLETITNLLFTTL